MVFGSSPLTRGKPETLRRDRHHDGLIPAHAGKTPPTRRPISPPEAHPRSRGENISDHVGIVEANGSSPLARGKPDCAGQLVEVWRLIPAHAGKTTLCGARLSPTSAHPRSRGEN